LPGNNEAPVADAYLGDDYLAVCRAAAGEEAAQAQCFADGIEAVLSGRKPDFEMEYPCHGPGRAALVLRPGDPFPGGDRPRVVVAHENITSR
jgi:hypothetical protein